MNITAISEIIFGIAMLYLSHLWSGSGTWGAFSGLVGLIVLVSGIYGLYKSR